MYLSIKNLYPANRYGKGGKVVCPFLGGQETGLDQKEKKDRAGFHGGKIKGCADFSASFYGDMLNCGAGWQLLVSGVIHLLQNQLSSNMVFIGMKDVGAFGKTCHNFSLAGLN